MPKQQKRNRKALSIFEGQTFLDPTYEPAFREVFKDERSLKDFLNAILHLDDESKIAKLDFAFENKVNFHFPGMKSVRLDIHAWTNDGRYLDIEMQRANHLFFTDRVLLYSSYTMIDGKRRMLRSEEYLHLEENEKRKKTYEVPETISIWLCNFHPLGVERNFRENWLLYSDYDLKNGIVKPITQKLKYILVDLKLFAKSKEPLKSDEDEWLFVLAKASKATETPNFTNPVVKDALERLRIASVEEKVLLKQRSSMISAEETECRLAERMDLGFNQGMAKGFDKGMAEGMAQGLSQGELQKAEIIARKLLAKGMSVEEVAELSELSEDHVAALTVK